MAITRIPDRYRPGLAAIRSLDDEVFAELVVALDHAPRLARFSAFSSRLASEVKGLNKRQIDDIIALLFSLSLSRADAEIPAEKTATEVLDAMRASGREDLKLSGEEESRLKSRISMLIDISSVKVSAKASRVSTDYPRTFCEAKILSDIRPVFDKPEEKPIGSMVCHTLRIDYHEGGEHKEFFIALDMDDLRELKKTIDRAETKTASLRSFLNASGIADFDSP